MMNELTSELMHERQVLLRDAARRASVGAVTDRERRRLFRRVVRHSS